MVDLIAELNREHSQEVERLHEEVGVLRGELARAVQLMQRFQYREKRLYEIMEVVNAQKGDLVEGSLVEAEDAVKRFQQILDSPVLSPGRFSNQSFPARAAPTGLGYRGPKISGGATPAAMVSGAGTPRGVATPRVSGAATPVAVASGAVTPRAPGVATPGMPIAAFQTGQGPASPVSVVSPSSIPLSSGSPSSMPVGIAHAHAVPAPVPYTAGPGPGGPLAWGFQGAAPGPPTKGLTPPTPLAPAPSGWQPLLPPVQGPPQQAVASLSAPAGPTRPPPW